MSLPDAKDLLPMISMVDVYKTLTGWTPKKTGKEWKGLCPFHADGDPSLSVNHTFWHCHAGCGSGNAIHFVERIKGVPFLDALSWLTEYAGGHAMQEHRVQVEKKRPTVVLTDGIVQHFQQGISDRVRAYYHSRGLTDATIETYRLGYGLMPASRVRQPRYAIPFIDRDGKPRTFRFRRDDSNPEDTGGKYMGLTGTPTYVFGLHQLPPTDWAILVGGQFDVMALAQMGLPALSGAGEAHFRTEWLLDILTAGVTTLYLLLDNEPAGAKGAESVLALARPLKDLSIVPVSWPDDTPEGTDVCDVIEQGWQKDDFVQLVCTAHLTNVR